MREQPLLFPNSKVLNGLGGVRNFVGHTCARWLSELIEGELMPDLPGQWYNTDVRKSGMRAKFPKFGWFSWMLYTLNIEVKSSGASGEFFIYTGRLMKDRIWSSMGNELIYCIWTHTATFKLPYEQPVVASLLAAKSKAIYFLSLATIKQQAEQSSPVKLNSNYGHHDDRENCYGSGYRFRLNRLSFIQMNSVATSLDGLERTLHVYSDPCISQTVQLLMRRRSQL